MSTLSLISLFLWCWIYLRKCKNILTFFYHFLTLRSCSLLKSFLIIDYGLGPDSIWRCHLTSIGNLIMEIRRSYDRLISTMGFPILVRWHLYIESLINSMVTNDPVNQRLRASVAILLQAFSVPENFEGIAGLRTGKTFKIAGPASLLQMFTVVTYDVFTKYCQSSRTCKYFILPVHPFYCQSGAEDLQFSWRLGFVLGI